MNVYRSELRWIALTGLVLWGAAAQAQLPDKFTNLKVLPKDISKAELQSTMRGFAFALNVRCDHCHAEKPGGKRFEMDFAADDKEAKKTARLMIEMVATINRDYINKISTTPIPVQCVTCHHGLTEPRTLNSVLAEAIDKKGIDSAVALYHDLRQKYYGSGQYDFGETSLNQLSESLLAQKKYKEAMAIMEMSFDSNHPDSVWSYHMLAMAHQANGQIDKAIADYRKVLELHPDDTWAKDQIVSLSKDK
ncbi:MAG TPA: c-type cytochrome [Candidatus Acidoferrum sp.]|nr:c-type cytochrome [Candidatus Acidoferrum sp.]